MRLRCRADGALIARRQRTQVGQLSLGAEAKALMDVGVFMDGQFGQFLAVAGQVPATGSVRSVTPSSRALAVSLTGCRARWTPLD